LSANSGNNAAFLTGLGVLGTTNAQTLTLGSGTTGNVVIAPQGTTALTANGANLTGAGTFTSTGLITGNAGLTVTGATNINTSGSSAINLGTGSYSGAIAIGNSSADISITDAQWSIASNGSASFVG